MRLVIIISFMSILLFSSEHKVKIGVLAKRGAEVTYKKWNPTAEYLSEKIPELEFEIVPIDFDDIFKTVENSEVSFILTNPGFYVELEYKYGVQRISTLINKHISGFTQKEFGGVLITHIDNKERFASLQAIKNSTLAAVDKRSLGGWQMISRELVEEGIDIEDGLESVVFKGTHDKVVYAVINKDVDVGTIRSDTVERMAMEGKIDLKSIHVINAKHYYDFPFMVSTRLYPEWPMAKLKNTPDELSKQVAVALMSMKIDDLAARSANIGGWSTPLSYQPVHACFKTLEIPPYYHEISTMEVIEKYWQWIVFYMFLAFAGISMFIYQRRITSHLKDTQEELIQTEKMASLGRLVAGVAHEINTPLGVGVTAASYLKKETETFKKEYENNNITKSIFEKYIDTASQSSEIILHNLERAATMIESFKQISVDQSSDKDRSFYLKSYIQSIISSLNPKLKLTSHTIELICEDDIFIESNPGAFSQIFSNLIINSLIHGFENKENGKITIKCIRESNELEITYSDNGKGMTKDNLSKIFDPFFTTKRGLGGSGLGTHIIYNIVTQQLHGSIVAKSEEGIGLTFIMHFKEMKYV